MHDNKCRLCNYEGILIEEIPEPVYYKCPKCDLIYIDDAYILSPEQEKKRYTLHNNSRNNEGYVSMLKDFAGKAVKPFIPTIKTGLDFGCGPSPVLAEILSGMNIDMDIYDPFFYNDSSFMNKKYDLITATEVLEHLREPQNVLNLLVSLLHENGYLSVMTLFHDNCDFKSWWYRQDSTHICFFSSATCSWIAQKYSLKIKYINEKNICVWQK